MAVRLGAGVFLPLHSSHSWFHLGILRVPGSQTSTLHPVQENRQAVKQRTQKISPKKLTQSSEIVDKDALRNSESSPGKQVRDWQVH